MDQKPPHSSRETERCDYQRMGQNSLGGTSVNLTTGKPDLSEGRQSMKQGDPNVKSFMETACSKRFVYSAIDWLADF